MRFVVIMAGGSGTRLWPLSRQGQPKQLLEIFDGKSLLRLAYERLAGLVAPEQILVCTGRSYAEDVARQLPELSSANILGEPIGRDSLNAVAWSAAVVAQRDPQAVVAMVTADQIITPKQQFQASLTTALEVAEQQPKALVTLGVVPTSPHTGYGYLRRATPLAGFDGVFRLAEFKEKPSLELAQRYLDSGEYWWNAGMFVWRAETLLQQLDQLLPETAAAVRRIAAHPEELDALFPTLKKTSVDYAVMEPAAAGETDAQVVSVGLEIDWKDVGGFGTLGELIGVLTAGNRTAGLSVNLDSSGCVVLNTLGDRHVVATIGLRDCLVVATSQATLVAPLAEAERVKELVALVSSQVGAEFA